MINFIDCKDKEKIKKALNSCCDSENIFSCRILCLVNSYGDYNELISIWIQYDENNHSTAVIIKYGGDMTVSLGEKADIIEIREFIALVGSTSVLSEKELFYGSESGVIMKLCERNSCNYQSSDLSVDFSPDLSEVHELLHICNSESFECPSYEDFILDTSHKLRHNCAYCCSVISCEKIVSYAMTSAMTDKSAVIGAVCTRQEYRGNGYGTLCVNSLISRLLEREIFLMRAMGENESFYKNLGFKNYGKFYIYRV